MPRSHAVADVEITDEFRFLVLALLRWDNQPGLFVILYFVRMRFMRKLFAVQIQMLQYAEVDKVAATAADLDVVFLFNIAPDLRIIAEAPEIKALENRRWFHR